jgi:hypothetical protein
LQSEDRTLYDSRAHSSDLGVTADNRDQMGSRSCIIAWLQNETIHLDSHLIDRILHASGEFQKTKALVSILHSCFLHLSHPSKALQVTRRTGNHPLLSSVGNSELNT